MKRVLIATPCLYGKVDAYYVHSLCESIKLGLRYEMHINAVFLAKESILPMARNELINLAYNQNYDVMVFIDDDEYWDPKALLNILLSPKDVVCLPVINKDDTQEKFNLYVDETVEKDKDGYIKVRKAGTGFMKLSRKVIIDLWESNPEVVFRNKKLKLVCDYTISQEHFVGEDITLCRKLQELGYTIWANPDHTVSHMGPKMYSGDFESYLNEKHTILQPMA